MLYLASAPHKYSNDVVRSGAICSNMIENYRLFVKWCHQSQNEFEQNVSCFFHSSGHMAANN